MSFAFDSSGQVKFGSKWDGDVKLFRSTWERHILARPEREQLKFNSGKIPTTLINPDYGRESRADGPDVHLYYKEFFRWSITSMIEAPILKQMRYLVVVVNTKGKFIMTAYSTGRVKMGKAL